LSKEKKISFKHYLHKRLKPSVVGGEKVYPLYTQVLFDRKNNNFPFLYEYLEMDMPYISESKYKHLFVDMADPSFTKKLKQFEDVFSQVIRFEYKYQQSKFDLKGIANRFDHYTSMSLVVIISVKSSNEISKYIKNDLVGKRGNESPYLQELFELMKHNPGMSIFAYEVIVKEEGEVISSESDFSKGIRAFRHFSNFIQTEYCPKGDVTSIEWITGDVKDQFLKYLIDLANGKDIPINGHEIHIDDMGDIEKMDIPGLINFINKAIVS
jgi:hypothetical protein